MEKKWENFVGQYIYLLIIAILEDGLVITLNVI